MNGDVLLVGRPPAAAPVQPCMSLKTKISLGVIGCALATAGVAGSVIGVGAVTGVIVGGSVLACMLLAKTITSTVTKSELIGAISTLAVAFFAAPLGAQVLMAYTGSTAYAAALNITHRIILPMLLANFLAAAATSDLVSYCGS